MLWRYAPLSRRANTPEPPGPWGRSVADNGSAFGSTDAGVHDERPPIVDMRCCSESGNGQDDALVVCGILPVHGDLGPVSCLQEGEGGRRRHASSLAQSKPPSSKQLCHSSVRLGRICVQVLAGNEMTLLEERGTHVEPAPWCCRGTVGRLNGPLGLLGSEAQEAVDANDHCPSPQNSERQGHKPPSPPPPAGPLPRPITRCKKCRFAFHQNMSISMSRPPERTPKGVCVVRRDRSKPIR